MWVPELQKLNYHLEEQVQKVIPTAFIIVVTTSQCRKTISKRKRKMSRLV